MSIPGKFSKTKTLLHHEHLPALESFQRSQTLYIFSTSSQGECSHRQSRLDVWHEHPVALNPASPCCRDYSRSISIANKGIRVKFNQPSPPTLAHTGAMGEHEHTQPDWALIWLLDLIGVNFSSDMLDKVLSVYCIVAMNCCDYKNLISRH